MCFFFFQGNCDPSVLQVLGVPVAYVIWGVTPRPHQHNHRFPLTLNDVPPNIK